MLSQKLIYLKINSIIPEVVFEGYNDVVAIVVGIVIVDSICFVFVVICINESVLFDADVAVITVENLEVIVRVLVVSILFVSDIRDINSYVNC